MNNPWTKITWNNTVADCDKLIINPTFCAENGIDIANLPEPYTGNIDSNVVCLNLNPGIGKCDPCFRFDKKFLRLTRRTLRNQIDHSFWIDDDLKCKHGGLHEGCEWWKSRTNELRKELGGIHLNMFVIEFFPYHTKSTIKFPQLPSDEYRNQLLNDAMDANKLIVIMRGKSLWYDIKDKSLGDVGLRLEKQYTNKVLLSNPRNPYFTPSCIKGNDWMKLIQELSKPTTHRYKTLI